MPQKRTTNGAVTLFDVAQEAGVHPSTVSRALDPRQRNRVKEPTRRRIVDTANRLGYRPHLVARGLQSGRTATVGVIVADLGNMFVTPIIHGLTNSLETLGMLPMIAETEDDRDRLIIILDHMLSRRVDALVVASARAGDRDILEAAGRLVPVIIAGRPLLDTSLPQVIHDDFLGGRLVAEHFHQLGHRRVVQLKGPEDVANFPLRTGGFSGYCGAFGIEEINLAEEATTPAIEEGARLASLLLEQPGSLPTGVFAHNDLMAIGALSVFRSVGIQVPATISLVGYNDLPMVGQIDPPLTTVRYPSSEVGKAAGEMLSQLLSGGRPGDRFLKPVLVIRSSTRSV